MLNCNSFPFLAAAPPNRVRAEAVSPSEVRLHWDLWPLHLQGFGHNVTGFVVSYKKVVESDVENWERHATAANATQTSIFHLSPYILYTFRVTAMMHSGLGVPSSYIDAYTMQGGMRDVKDC